MKKILLFYLLLVSGILIISCNGNGVDLGKNKVVCTLFDLSETTNTPEIRKTYLGKFKLVLSTMQPGDAITAALVTEKSLSELDLSINYDFPVLKPLVDTDLFKKKVNMQTDSIMSVKRDSLLAEADSILFKPKRKILYTEILSSLKVAERIFKSFDQSRKILVIFSDMIEDSRLYNFDRENLNTDRINRIIKTEKDKKSIPDLREVKIYVAGASHSNSERYDMIKNFWFEYFKACGAKIEPQNYGSALIKFKE